MPVLEIPPGRIGIDTVSDTKTWADSKPEGIAFAARYLGSITPLELEHLGDAGILWIPVTFGGWNPNKITAQKHAAQTLGLLAQLVAPHDARGLNIFLDLEAQDSHPYELQTWIVAWSQIIVKAGLIAGLYYGAGGQLSGPEIHHIPDITRYWKGCSHLLDRNSELVEPVCGWSLIQCYPPNQTHGKGLVVDYNMSQTDFKGRHTNGWINP